MSPNATTMEQNMSVQVENQSALDDIINYTLSDDENDSNTRSSSSMIKDDKNLSITPNTDDITVKPQLVKVEFNGKYKDLSNLPKLSSSDEDNFIFDSKWKKSDSNSSTSTTPNESLISNAKDFNLTIDKLSTPMRSKRIQLSYEFPIDSLSELEKSQFDSLLSSLKNQFNVHIETTLTKSKRLFLFSGEKSNILNAKRILLKNLTKPERLTFTIPFKTRSAVIGTQGNKISNISKTFDIKITINSDPNPNSYDDYLDDSTVNVTLNGDNESILLAKKKILDIVKDETKDARFRIEIKKNNDYSRILPFINPTKLAHEMSTLNNAKQARCIWNERLQTFTATGLRDDASTILKRLTIELDTQINLITDKEIKIPIKFQGLIDTNYIKQNFNVIVKLSETWDNEIVKFIGEKIQIDKAIDYSRSSSKDLILDILDISKSHSNNLEFSKILILYFMKYKLMKPIENEYDNKIKLVLPSLPLLKTGNQVNINIFAKPEDKNEVKFIRKEIIHLVNSITPKDTLEIDNLDHNLFHHQINHILSKSAEQVNFIQVGDSFPDSNTVVLFSKTTSDDFKPDEEETQKILQDNAKLLEPLHRKAKDFKNEIIDLKSSIQDDVFAPTTATLRLIEDEILYGDGNASINLHRPTQDQVEVVGNSHGLKIAMRALEYIKQEPSRFTRKEISIPSHVIARLVGNKGNHLATVRREFDVSIEVPRVENANDSRPIDVALIGLSYNIRRCANYLKKEVNEWANIITVEKKVPLQYHQTLLGENGAYRQRLQKKYKVRISFFKDTELVTIRGEQDEVKKAQKELKSLLDYEMQNNQKITIQVPSSQLAGLLGKNGNKINSIRSRNDVTIRVITPKQNSDEEFATVDITGMKENIESAKKDINSTLKELTDVVTEEVDIEKKYHSLIIGTNGDTLNDIIKKAGGENHTLPVRPITVPAKNSEKSKISVRGPKVFVEKVSQLMNQIMDDEKNRITQTVPLPKNQRVVLIGPVGLTRKMIEEEYNVALNIPNNNNKEDMMKISGLKENIDKAMVKINHILETNGTKQVEIKVPAEYHEFVSGRNTFLQSLKLDYFVSVQFASDTTRANKILRRNETIPLEKIEEDNKEDKKQITFTVEEFEIPEDLKEQQPITWILEYSPIALDSSLSSDKDFAELIGKKEEAIDKSDGDAMLQKVKSIIQHRIEVAKDTDHIGYLWCVNPKRFSKVVGYGGTRINEIRDQTETVITIPRPKAKINNVVVIKGSKEHVEKAGGMIMKAMSNKN